MYNKDLACLAQASVMDSIHCSVNLVSSPMWDWLVWILICIGVFFTVMTGFVQFRLFGHSVKNLLASRSTEHHEHSESISSFQAFMTGLASRVGTGNIAGVAIAVSVGGPGAVFWMWFIALIGMASAFAESSLAQLFKVRDANGHFRGGPAYYIRQGLGQGWLGVAFAVSLILCFGLVYNAIQANTIAQAVQSAVGCTGDNTCASWGTGKHVVALLLVIISAPIIFGGIKRVATISEMLVPVMAGVYLLMALYIIVTNITMIPQVFNLILTDAFTFNAAAGGALGGLVSQSMMLGIKRGLYSNEAGQGSAPNAAAAADVPHPATQGLIQSLGVFVDTIIVCSCTAFIILLSKLPTADLTGIQLTQAALESHVGSWAQIFLAVVLFMFAFSSIIGNYAYAETNVQYLKNHPMILNIFRIFVLAFVYFGSVAEVPMVWDMGDLMMAIMAYINLVSIVLLSKYVFILAKDYSAQIKSGVKHPVFNINKYPAMKAKVTSGIWEK
ncbi:MAG: alanine:cation symporter family protein [Moraxella sp.]|nr:alanine:cation symporter family protein [Moraxella sp.]